MKIQYLGTAAAERIPAIFCNCPTCKKALELGGKNIMTHSQVLLDDTLLIDFSSDTWQHFMALGRTVEAISHLLITHSHSDHFSMDELLFRSGGMAKDVTAETLHIYASCDVLKIIEDRLAKCTEKKLAQMQGRLEMHLLEYFVPSKICGFTVTPLPATHAGEENAMIFLIEKDGKTLFYGNDTGIFTTRIDDYLVKNKKHVDLLSLDCTKGNQPFTYAHHMSMAEGRSIADRFFEKGILDEKSLLYYTHFSHNCMNVHDELEEIAKGYGFSITHDGFTVEI